MSFNTMSFKDLRDIHSLQIYNDNPEVGKEDQFDDAYDMMANIMEFKKDLKKWFSDLFKKDYLSSDIIFKKYEEATALYNKGIITETERVSRIKGFFEEISNLESKSYRDSSLRPIL
jgi:hypothetical protein